MSRSTEAFQGSASGVVSGGLSRETALNVYNLERFQRDGAPSSVASLAGGAAPPNHVDRLREHLRLFGAVDSALGDTSTHAGASAGAAANAASSSGKHKT